MDPSLGFAQLLGIAQYNQKDKTTNDKAKLLKTKVGGARKEKREKGKVAPNVQKFLQQKEEEERRKKIEEKQKREKLNDLRSERSKNKIAKHLKVTKSANKAVISDAVDTKNTSVTLKGRKQCDEDDYGYESKTSAGLYEKLMSKYEADPDDPMAKFSKSRSRELKDIQGTKDRVKQALRREEEDLSTPGKKRRRKKEAFEDDGFIDDSLNYSKKKEDKFSLNSDKKKREEEARRKRIENSKKAPPPVDFNSLLKLANEKKDQPVKVEKKAVVKESEFGRPMSKREKEEYIRDNEARLRREGKLPPKEKPQPIPKLSDKRDRGSSEEKTEKVVEKPKIKAEPGPSFHSAVIKSMDHPDKRKEDARKSALERERKEIEAKMKELDRKREELDKKTKIEEYNRKKKQEYERKMEEIRRRQVTEQKERRKLDDERKNLDAMQLKYKEMQREMKEMEARMSAGGSKRDVNSVEARSLPFEKKKRDHYRDRGGSSSNGYKRRLESDSEEEYDSEMDDFIDDTDAKVDISAEIRSIFGYDKRKYRDEGEFDDRMMENNKFSSIMMEEARSARIGRMEDLEDIRREEEEKKRKKRR